MLWINLVNPDFCHEVERTQDWLSRNALKAHLIFFIWCFLLSLTVIPLGSTSVIIAGALLGPTAGLDLYFGSMLSSFILFELGRDKDASALAARFEAFPRLIRLANFCRNRGLLFVILARILPILTSAMGALAACYFHISRWDFYVGTVLGAWVRPMLFATMAALAASTLIGENELPLLEHFSVCNAHPAEGKPPALDPDR